MEKIKKHARVWGSERAELTAKFRAQYERGASIRAIAELCGRSYGFVYTLLTESGVPLRPRGGQLRRRV